METTIGWTATQGKLKKATRVAMSMAGLPFLIPFVDGDDPKKVARFAMSHCAIWPQQVPSEFEAFAAMVAAQRPKSILEIGSLRGGNLFMLCRMADPTATIISIDMTPWYHRNNRRPLMRFFPLRSQRLYLRRADSHASNTFAEVRKLSGGKIDLLFIDGDHSYEGAKQDFVMYSALVAPGGMIVFHDIVEHHDKNHCDVVRLWRELKPQYRHTELIENPTQDSCGIGILHV
jgi:predicted O-methyltransferase YrrM